MSKWKRNSCYIYIAISSEILRENIIDASHNATGLFLDYDLSYPNVESNSV
jgi:hypothetical protein